MKRVKCLLALTAVLSTVGVPAAAARVNRAGCVSGVFAQVTRCRVAVHGASERYVRLTAYSLFVPDWPLAVNPAVGARMWPLRNSLGQTFAWIAQRWDQALPGLNKTAGWSVYEGDGRTLIDVRNLNDQRARDSPNAPYLAIQGYGCMLDPKHAADPMVVLLHAGFGDAGNYVGVRGFIEPAALPQGRGAIVNRGAREYAHRTKRGPATRGRTVAQVLRGAHARTGCTQRDVGFAEPRASNTAPFQAAIVGNLLDPQFDWFYRYNGKFPGHEHKPRVEPFAPGVRRILTAPADNRYANYATFPPPAIDAPGGPPGTLGERLARGRPNVQARIEASTTGVHAGGIVRAILPPQERYVVKDWFGYSDPNGYCGRSSNAAFEAPARIVQWVLIAVPGTPLEGWVPRKLPGRYDGRGCG